MHLAHPLGVKAFEYRRVKNDERDAKDLADLLRMGRLPEADLHVSPRLWSMLTPQLRVLTVPTSFYVSANRGAAGVSPAAVRSAENAGCERRPRCDLPNEEDGNWPC